MIESRCGILCRRCEVREEVGCKGCIHIEKPFWGEECPVKSCCEGMGYMHCGECEMFPCDMLNEFSYAKEHGDDGKRIAQCKIWKDK